MSKSQKSAPPFIVLWRKALFNSDLPPLTRLVGLAMAESADTATGKNVYPSAQRLAAKTGLSLRSVFLHRRRLVTDYFAVEVFKGGTKGGHSENSKFELVIPTPAADAPLVIPTHAGDAPLGVQQTTQTPAADAHYRSLTGSSTSAAPGLRPPLASAGPVASPKADDEDALTGVQRQRQ